MKFTTIYNDPYTRVIQTYPWAYWDGAFTEEELKKVEEYCDGHQLERAKTVGSTDEKEVEKVRKSNVLFFKRNSDTAWIFDKLNFILQSANEMFYGFDLNGYESFQYTTYSGNEKGRYDWHMDMNMGCEQTAQTRKLSLTLLLNDDFEGGEFEINGGNHKKPIAVQTQKGRAILFPSFMIHRVKPVTKGTRKSIVVWCLGPKFT